MAMNMTIGKLTKYRAMIAEFSKANFMFRVAT